MLIERRENAKNAKKLAEKKSFKKNFEDILAENEGQERSRDR